MTNSSPNPSSTAQSTPIDLYDQSTHNSCELCGRTDALATLYAFPGNEPVQMRTSIIPEQYNRLCSSCFPDANEHTPFDLEDDELIAGIISDSYGYATPGHAARHLKDAQNGKTKCHCERGHAHFNNDLNALLEAGRKRWLTRSPEEKEALLKTVAGWRDIEHESKVAAMGISMAYPSRSPELTDPQQSSEDTQTTNNSNGTTRELHETLFLNTDTYRFFIVDLIDNDDVYIQYTDNTYTTHISRSRFNTLLTTSTPIDLSEYDTPHEVYEETFLEPVNADIDALRATLRRSSTLPQSYTKMLIALSIDADHFEDYQL